MSRAARYRLAFVLAAVLALEVLCRVGVIDHLTMQPPSEMVRDLAVLLASGAMNGAMLKTFINVAIAAGPGGRCRHRLRRRAARASRGAAGL